MWCYDKDGNVPQRLPRDQTRFKGFPTSTLDRDMVVKEFYGEQGEGQGQGPDRGWDRDKDREISWI